MLLNTKDGISCDICGTIYKDNFVYYSWESTKFAVSPPSAPQQEKDLDTDVCEKCYGNAESKVKAFIADRLVPGTIKCDFCSDKLSGKFIYHRFLIHKVTIDKAQQTKGPVSVGMNHMDFNVGDDCFIELANLVTATRQKIKQSGGWS